MNSEQIKSLVRHLLTAIGILLTFLGVDKFIPMLEYLQSNLDEVFASVATIVGVIVTIIGFFNNKDRWQKEEDQK
jgi:hypothetical protein